VKVRRPAQERDCDVALVRIEVRDRIQRVEEPLRVAVSFALIEQDVLLPSVCIPGRAQSGVATSAATRSMRGSTPANATATSPPIDTPPATRGPATPKCSLWLMVVSP
jgi:hypothetical protein